MVISASAKMSLNYYFHVFIIFNTNGSNFFLYKKNMCCIPACFIIYNRLFSLTATRCGIAA